MSENYIYMKSDCTDVLELLDQRGTAQKEGPFYLKIPTMLY